MNNKQLAEKLVLEEAKGPVSYKYVTKDGKTTTEYNDAGLFTLEDAAKMVIGVGGKDRVISPDASNKWVVIEFKNLPDMPG